MRDLHRIAATQARRLRALIAFEPFEFLALAARAIDFAQQRRDLDAAADVFPHVDVDQLTVDRFELARQDLQALRDLEAGDDADDRGQDAGRLAGARFPWGRSRLEDAAQ